MLNLAEELLLLGLDDRSGAPHRWAGTALPLGCAGALLIELQLMERIEVGAKGVVSVVDPRPTFDPALDRALTRIGESRRPRRLDHWTGTLSRNLLRDLAEGLAERGILERERLHLFGLFPVSRYPERTSGPEQQVRAWVLSALRSGKWVDPRLRALVTLTRACHVLGTLVQETRALRRRVGEMVREDPYGRPIAQMIEATEAAAVTAIGGGG